MMKKSTGLFVLAFSCALLWGSGATFARAQTYGGSTYGDSLYSGDTSTPTPTPTPSSSGGGGVISGPLSQGYVNTTNATTTVGIPANTGVAPAGSASTTPSRYTSFLNAFNRNLKQGNEGQDVKMLQLLLNAEGFLVASLGVGSPGLESTYFGSRTLQALVRFQNAHAAEILKPVGLTVGSGYFGASTRAFLATYLLGK